jgi:hypothetical protein
MGASSGWQSTSAEQYHEWLAVLSSKSRELRLQGDFSAETG